MDNPIYDFEVMEITGNTVCLDKYRGKVLLIVNTASQCGFTPQYEGLEALYQELKGQGLEVLGFPCNQFGQQEKGTDKDIQQFCQLNFGVTFPLFSKIEVNGPKASPLYQYLKKSAWGIFGSEPIKWNFTKFLIGRDGQVIDRFAPTAKPEKIKKTILKALAQ